MLKEYLGDGVYAEIENGMVKMTTEDGISVTNIIYLEPAVYEALKRYVSRVKAAHRVASGMIKGA
jgi:hypothetical protein